MRSRLVATVASMVILVVGAGADAGIRDDPAPTTDDGPGKVVYRLGAIAYDPGHVDFTVTCTNIGTKKLHVMLEVYGDDERRVGDAASMKLEPEAMGTFTSDPAVVAGGGSVVRVSVPPLDHGRARVAANRGSVVCTALMRVRGDDGETREVPVTLLKRIAPPE